LTANHPILFVNPGTKPPPRFKNILFPTDLTPPSRAMLAQVLATAKCLDATVTLYNKLETYVPSPGLSWSKTPIYSEQIAKEAEKRREVLLGWATKAAEKSGVRV